MMRVFIRTFRQRVAVLFVALWLLMGLPTLWYIDRVYERHLIEAAGKQLRDVGISTATVLARNLRDRQREIILLSETPLYRRAPFDSPELKASIERVQETFPDYSWVGFADREGTVRAATGNLLVGANVGTRPWFKAGLGRPSVSGPHEAPMLGNVLSDDSHGRPPRLIDLSVPVLAEDGSVRGVLGFRLRGSWVSTVVQPLTSRGETGDGLEAFVIDENGAVIHPAGGPAISGLATNTRSAHASPLEHQEGGTTYVSAIVPVPPTALSNPVGWRVVVRRPSRLILADATALMRVLVSLEILAAVVFAALAWWITGVLSRPIQQLASVARQIERGAESTDFAVRTASHEVLELADALHGMTDTLLSRKQVLAESNRQVTEHSAALEKANEQLRQLSRRDALTGLANRLGAEERINDEFIRMKRTGICYAVLMMDIDTFKSINDTHGHAVGDEVLRHIGSVLKSTVRQSDFVARYGGEEFLAILPATGLADACHVAEEVQRAVASTPAPGAGVVTLSIGLALAGLAETDMAEVVRQADRWLYEAKRSGRNRVAGPGIRWDRNRARVFTHPAGSARA